MPHEENAGPCPAAGGTGGAALIGVAPASAEARYRQHKKRGRLEGQVFFRNLRANHTRLSAFQFLRGLPQVLQTPRTEGVR